MNLRMPCQLQIHVRNPIFELEPKIVFTVKYPVFEHVSSTLSSATRKITIEMLHFLIKCMCYILYEVCMCVLNSAVAH